MDLMTQRSFRRRAAFTTAFALTVFVCIHGGASAERRAPPLPPHRPSEFGGSQPAPPSPSPAPSIAAPPAHAAEENEPPLDPDHPPMLPPASRARMSQCGREWQAMKLAGKDIGVGWRQFATGCLTR